MNAIYDRRWQAYLLLLPTLVASLAFVYYPAADTLRLSFYRTVALGAPRQYVGLDNFVRLLEDQTYQTTFGVTLMFVAIVVIGAVAASLYIGYLLYKVDRGKPVYLVSVVSSYTLSFAVAAMVFNFLLHPTVGIGSHLIRSVVGVSFDWFQNGALAFAIVAFVTVWKLVGFNVIFVLGALGGIPDTINETAKLDGIGDLRMLFQVYIPLISPTLAFLVITNTIYAFFLPFPVVDLMTSGGPGNATNLLIYQLWQDAFEFSRIGKAAAESIILFIVVGVLMVSQLVISDRLAHYRGGD